MDQFSFSSADVQYQCRGCHVPNTYWLLCVGWGLASGCWACKCAPEPLSWRLHIDTSAAAGPKRISVVTEAAKLAATEMSYTGINAQGLLTETRARRVSKVTLQLHTLTPLLIPFLHAHPGIICGNIFLLVKKALGLREREIEYCDDARACRTAAAKSSPIGACTGIMSAGSRKQGPKTRKQGPKTP